MSATEKRWLPEDEAAVFLNLAPATLRDMRHKAEGPRYYKRMGGRGVQYDPQDLVQWRWLRH